ncbi:MAG: dihydrolipoyl dehydrogenase, partial [Candidatus Roizmanbacteria bacterium]
MGKEIIKSNKYENILLNTKVTQAKATAKGIEITFEGSEAPKGVQVFDKVLVCVGRSPNGKKIDAEKAGVKVDERGFI